MLELSQFEDLGLVALLLGDSDRRTVGLEEIALEEAIDDDQVLGGLVVVLG